MNLNSFGLSGGRRKTLVILGAGASRGASFVTDQTGVLPPLDLDFFQQLARMDYSKDSRRLLEFIRSEYGHEIGLSMEKFFSEADYTNRFHQELNVDRGPFVKRYQRALDNFMCVLPKILAETTSKECEHHKRLASLLHVQDCIISFNYDCLIDSALRDCASNRWDPDKEGYGFAITGGGQNWKEHKQGRPPQKSIRLLKMHGSTNWEMTHSSISLANKVSDIKTLEDSIIPPTWFKNLTAYPFGDIWKAARKEIRTSRVMIVVGYSVPETDLFSRSLFKVEAGSKMKREKLDLLILVNPDQGSRRLFIELVREGLEPSTRILEYQTLENLSTVLARNSGDG